MESGWNVIFYKTLQGDTPINDFILSLETKTQSKIRDSIKLLTEYGIRLGQPHVKKLTGTELWELRIVGSNSIRIFYIAVSGKNFLLLHGFKKKKDKTQPKEIKTAENRLAEFRSRP